MIKLGSIVKDSVSGFQGMATARTEWMYGCSRIMIEPMELRDGKPVEGQWIDEQRVVVMNEQSPVVSSESSAVSGGPKNDPSPRACPSR